MTMDFFKRMDELTQGNEKKAQSVSRHAGSFLAHIFRLLFFNNSGVSDQLIKTGLHGPSGQVFVSKS